MGKLTKKDVEVLENSGVLDEETTAGIRAKHRSIQKDARIQY